MYTKKIRNLFIFLFLKKKPTSLLHLPGQASHGGSVIALNSYPDLGFRKYDTLGQKPKGSPPKLSFLFILLPMNWYKH